MERLKRVVTVLRALLDKRFYGQVEIHFENGEPVRYYLKESVQL
jgi:hypothetical protein